MSESPNNLFPVAAETLANATQRVAVTKDVFLQLPQAVQLRAFTVAGITETTVLQEIYDAVGQHIQQGGTLWTFKEQYPELVDKFRADGREWHLNLVVRQNQRQAEAVGAYSARQRTKAAFPYVEYSAGENPRPSHAALDGKIFEVDDPFLATHTPPWDFNCNCDLTPRRSAGATPESGPANLGVHQQTGTASGYTFRPDQLNQAVDLSGYDPALRARLESQLAQFGYQVAGDVATPMKHTAGGGCATQHTAGGGCATQHTAGGGCATRRHVGRPRGGQDAAAAVGRMTGRIGRPIALTARVGRPVHHRDTEITEDARSRKSQIGNRRSAIADRRAA